MANIVRDAIVKAFGRKKNQPAPQGREEGSDELPPNTVEDKQESLKTKMRKAPMAFLSAPKRIANKWAGTKFKVNPNANL